MQITRKQVESYEPGHQIPSVQLQVFLTKEVDSHKGRDALKHLVCVDLLGTQPFCTFQIVLSTQSPIPIRLPGMWIWTFPIVRQCKMVLIWL